MSIPYTSSRSGEIQKMLTEAFEDEHRFMLQGADKIRLGWMPFQMADFVAIMTEVLVAAEGTSFLEVGSGIGTKMMVAEKLFGLYPFGIEYSETLATVSGMRGRGSVWVGDALTYPRSYGDYDIVWMYRCFRDVDLQDELEQRIYSEMKSGAVFAGAALQNAPAGWTTVVDDYDMGNRGAWKKP